MASAEISGRRPSATPDGDPATTDVGPAPDDSPAADPADVSARASPGPAFIPAGRPMLTHGTQSGDPVDGGANVWTRADQPGRMVVEVSTDREFRRTRRILGPQVGPDTDFTGQVRVDGIPPGVRTYYRTWVEAEHGRSSFPQPGSLIIPDSRNGIRFVWTGDIVGQGYGINPDFGGMRIFRAMRAEQPDFFLCSGDTVYADEPLLDEIPLPDGRIWYNILTPGKDGLAETLDQFRGQYAYNLLDVNLREFLAEVPQINQWDDHEVTDNWYPGEILADDHSPWFRYTERRVDVLAARARRAFYEWLPITPGVMYRSFSYAPLLEVFKLDMRSYRDPNDDNRYTDPGRGVLGAAQREWLVSGLLRSQAIWKVIANSTPLSVVIPDGHEGHSGYEGVAQGDPGPPLGRELEFAHILHTAHRHGVTGIVFLTADVHYTAAHHYHPERAAFRGFTPFWEFVSGPANCGGFPGPEPLDATFGPEVVFAQGAPRIMASPMEGYQYFGEVAIDAQTKAMTVRLCDQDGTVVWEVTLTAPVREPLPTR